MVTFPPWENARTASSEFKTTTNSVMSKDMIRIQRYSCQIVANGCTHTCSDLKTPSNTCNRQTARPVNEPRITGGCVLPTCSSDAARCTPASIW
jgi:hypothetical protein